MTPDIYTPRWEQDTGVRDERDGNTDAIVPVDENKSLKLIKIIKVRKTEEGTLVHVPGEHGDK